MTNDVQIVKIPVSWNISQNDALMLQMGTKEEAKQKQKAIYDEREKDEAEGRKELANFLNDDYRLLSTVLLQSSVGSFLVYTLYHG